MDGAGGAEAAASGLSKKNFGHGFARIKTDLESVTIRNDPWPSYF
jgi:hypothetical protein